MSINTQQLRTALQTAASNLQTGWNDPTGDAKVENLNLKRVYLGSDKQLHVSNHGWSSALARLRGRPTGEAALRAGLEQAKLPAGVIDRALQGVTTFQQKHADWQAKRHTEIRLATVGVEAKVTAGPEPSRDLEGIIGEAGFQELQSAKEKASMLAPKEAGKQAGEAIVRSCSQSDDPLGQLGARLERLNDQLKNAEGAASNPKYAFKPNEYQAERMRTLHPHEEIERLKATIGVVKQEISRLSPDTAAPSARRPADPARREKIALEGMMGTLAGSARYDDFLAAARIKVGKTTFLSDSLGTIEKHPVMKHVAQRFLEHLDSLEPQWRQRGTYGNHKEYDQMAINFANEYHAQNPGE